MASSVAVSRATFCGRRRASTVMQTPSVTERVSGAMAASVVHGSATGSPDEW